MSALSAAILTAIRSGQPATASDAIKTALAEKVTAALASQRRSLAEGLLREDKGIITKANDGGVNLTVKGADGKRATFWYKTRESAMEYAKSANITLSESTTRVWELKFKGTPKEVDTLRKKGYDAIMLAGGTIRVAAPDANDGWGEIGTEVAMFNALGIDGEQEIHKRRCEYKILKEGTDLDEAIFDTDSAYEICFKGKPSEVQTLRNRGVNAMMMAGGDVRVKAQDIKNGWGGKDVVHNLGGILGRSLKGAQVSHINEDFNPDPKAKFKVGDRVKPSDHSLDKDRTYALNLGRSHPRFRIFWDAVEKRAAKRGVVTASGHNGHAMGVSVKWDDGTTSDSMEHMVMLASERRYNGLNEATEEFKCYECGKTFSRAVSKCSKCGGSDIDVFVPTKDTYGTDKKPVGKKVKDLTEASGRLAVAAKKSDGTAIVYLGDDEVKLSGIYNGWKSSGSDYNRVAQGKIPKSMTDATVRERMAKQFGVSPDKVTLKVLNESVSQDLYNDVVAHLNGGGEMFIVTHYKRTGPFKQKHASMIRASKRDADRGIYFQSGKMWLYAPPETIVFQKGGQRVAVPSLQTEEWAGTCKKCNGKLWKTGSGRLWCSICGVYDRPLYFDADGKVAAQPKRLGESMDMPVKTVQRVFDENGDVKETELLCGIRNLKVDHGGSVVAYVNEGTKYITCPECDANFPETQLKDGKLPQHSFNRKPCPGAGNLAEDTFKKIGQPLAPLVTRVRRVNAFLADTVGKTYYHQIPLNDIFKKLRENGLEPIQEDGESWVGFLTGRDGRASIDLRDEETGKTSPRVLTLTWHKMDVSGKYEVTAYVN